MWVDIDSNFGLFGLLANLWIFEVSKCHRSNLPIFGRDKSRVSQLWSGDKPDGFFTTTSLDVGLWINL